MRSLFLQPRCTKRASLTHLCLCNTAHKREPESRGWPPAPLPHPALATRRDELSGSLPARLGTRRLTSATGAGCAASQPLVETRITHSPSFRTPSPSPSRRTRTQRGMRC